MKSSDFDKEFDRTAKVIKFILISMIVLFPIFFIGTIAMNVYMRFYAPCETVRGLSITEIPVRCL
jgi:hypothetical protein